MECINKKLVVEINHKSNHAGKYTQVIAAHSKARPTTVKQNLSCKDMASVRTQCSLGVNAAKVGLRLTIWKEKINIE